jgi:predicted acylesterase/phospholipase RssA
MSSNLPLVFERYKYGNCLYVDGGISDNFPIQLVDDPTKKVLGLLLDVETPSFDTDVETNTLEYIYDLLCIPIIVSVEYKISTLSQKCEIIRIPAGGYKFFDFNLSSSTKLNLFSEGYEHMRSVYDNKR